MSALEESKPVLMRPAALWWASKGVPVFPLHNATLTPMLEWACTCGDPCTRDSPAKHPRTAHGVHDASTDPKVVNAWWERWPEANVGLACGVKFDLLDIDGPAGFEALAQLEAELGPLTPMAVMQSGRKDGGRHYYLSPPGLGNLAGGKTSPVGIDVKSVGGYAVAPPSQHITGYRYIMSQPYAEHGKDSNWEAVHARLREMAPQKPRVEVTKRDAVPAEHRSEQWRKRARGWCAKALEGVASVLAGMGENSGRNNHLNDQTWRMLRFAHAGHLEADVVIETMRHAAETSGLSRGEIEATLASAIRGADGDGPLDPNIGEDHDFDPFAALDAIKVDESTGEVVEDVAEVAPLAEVAAGTATPDIPPPPALTVDEDAFWDSRPELQHIRTFARARMASPWGVLGVVLARVVVATPHWVVLPAIVGSHASLNLFTALVGPSGGGKGAAESAAGDCFVVKDVNGEEVEVATVGSGEGIGHLYAHREKGEVVRDRDAVLFTVPEVDNLVALAGRQGATLLPQLRSAWSGEKLGFAYADKAKALPLNRHTYRLGLVLGIQPGRAAPLLEDADGGTPQRFLWMPTDDPGVPDEPPVAPAAPLWQLTGAWVAPAGSDPFSGAQGVVEMPVPEIARRTIIDNRRARLRGSGEALDGHALQCRLKVAAALALLAGRRSVEESDWHLSETIMAVSDATRASVVTYLSSKAAQSNKAKGEAEGTRAVVVAEKIADAQIKRVARRVLTLLRVRGEMTRAELRRAVAARDRQHFDEAVDRLAEAGTVAVQDVEGGQKVAAVS